MTRSSHKNGLKKNYSLLLELFLLVLTVFCLNLVYQKITFEARAITADSEINPTSRKNENIVSLTISETSSDDDFVLSFPRTLLENNQIESISPQPKEIRIDRESVLYIFYKNPAEKEKNIKFDFHSSPTELLNFLKSNSSEKLKL